MFNSAKPVRGAVNKNYWWASYA